MNALRTFALIALALVASAISAQAVRAPTYFPVVRGAHPHDVAASREPGGAVYYTAQATGKLGILDPATGKVDEVALGDNSAPHGVVVGPDGAPWITDGGQNAIVRVDPKTHVVKRWPLPASASNANLNTLTFDRAGRVWFTGQSGYYGRVDPANGDVKVWRAPRGTGPYGITTTPSGDVYYASLAGNHIARIDVETGEATVIEPPTPKQGARRVWSDSKGRVWVSYWNTGQVGRYDPRAAGWKFLFQGYDIEIWKYDITSFDDWKTILTDKIIEDEYGEKYSLEQFIEIVEGLQNGQSRYDIEIADYVFVDNEGYEFCMHEFS
jgi:virginiamycin B lyase